MAEIWDEIADGAAEESSLWGECRRAAPDRVAVFESVVRSNANQLARLHALWGLGQIGRKRPEALAPLVDLLTDHDAEIRAQTAKVLGDGRVACARDRLLALIHDPEPRVRFFATLSAGKFGDKAVLEPVLQMLRNDAGRDAYLRHAGVMALAWCASVDDLTKIGQDSSACVRTAALLALRRLGSPEVARFLHDPDAAVGCRRTS